MLHACQQKDVHGKRFVISRVKTQYVTLWEFNARQETGNEQILISVLEHKTTVALRIIISIEIEILMVGYCNKLRTQVFIPQIECEKKLANGMATMSL